jgi:hypothetical protein
MASMLRKSLSVAVIAASLLCVGCANEFERNFQGQRAAEVEHSLVVPWGPTPPGMEFMGSSTFVSAQGAGAPEAQAAAQALGADAVAWRRQFLNSSQQLHHRTITHEDQVKTEGSLAGVPFTSTSTIQRTESVPYTITSHWYSYEARFFRRVRE